MKNLIIGVVVWFISREQTIAKLLYFSFWIILSLQFFFYFAVSGQGDWVTFSVCFLGYFIVSDMVFVALNLLYGQKRVKFLLEVFTVEVEDGWMTMKI